MRRELSVGFLFIFAILSLVYMLNILNQERGIEGEVKTYYTLVDDSIGLLPGSPVKVAGIDVGKLSEKALQGNQAKLTLKVNHSLEIYRDASIQLQTIGYLGDRYLKLDPGSNTELSLREGSFIPTQQEVTLDQLMTDGASLLESWTKVAHSLRVLIGD